VSPADSAPRFHRRAFSGFFSDFASAASCDWRSSVEKVDEVRDEVRSSGESQLACAEAGVAAPPPERVSNELRVAEKGIAEALSSEPPKETPPEPPTVETLDYDPSLVYTDTAQYLNEFGVNLPMWDEAIDSQIRALDQAHLDALAADEEAISRLALDRLVLEAEEGILDKSLPKPS